MSVKSATHFPNTASESPPLSDKPKPQVSISTLTSGKEYRNQLQQSAEAWLERQYGNIFGDDRSLYSIVTQYSGVLPRIISVLEYLGKSIRGIDQDNNWINVDMFHLYFSSSRVYHYQLRENAEEWLECQYGDIFGDVRPLYGMVTDYLDKQLPVRLTSVLEYFGKFLRGATQNNNWADSDVLNYYFFNLRPNTKWCGFLFPHQMVDEAGKYHQMMRITLKVQLSSQIEGESEPQIDEYTVPGLVCTIESHLGPIECLTLLPIKVFDFSARVFNYECVIVRKTEASRTIETSNPRNSGDRRTENIVFEPDAHELITSSFPDWCDMEWDDTRTPIVYSQKEPTAPHIHRWPTSWTTSDTFSRFAESLLAYRENEKQKRPDPILPSAGALVAILQSQNESNPYRIDFSRECDAEMLEGILLEFNPICLTAAEEEAQKKQRAQIKKRKCIQFELLTF